MKDRRSSQHQSPQPPTPESAVNPPIALAAVPLAPTKAAPSASSSHSTCIVARQNTADSSHISTLTPDPPVTPPKLTARRNHAAAIRNLIDACRIASPAPNARVSHARESRVRGRSNPDRHARAVSNDVKAAKLPRSRDVGGKIQITIDRYARAGPKGSKVQHGQDKKKPPSQSQPYRTHRTHASTSPAPRPSAVVLEGGAPFMDSPVAPTKFCSFPMPAAKLITPRRRGSSLGNISIQMLPITPPEPVLPLGASLPARVLVPPTPSFPASSLDRSGMPHRPSWTPGLAQIPQAMPTDEEFADPRHRGSSYGYLEAWLQQLPEKPVPGGPDPITPSGGSFEGSDDLSTQRPCGNHGRERRCGLRGGGPGPVREYGRGLRQVEVKSRSSARGTVPGSSRLERSNPWSTPAAGDPPIRRVAPGLLHAHYHRPSREGSPAKRTRHSGVGHPNSEAGGAEVDLLSSGKQGMGTPAKQQGRQSPPNTQGKSRKPRGVPLPCKHRPSADCVGCSFAARHSAEPNAASKGSRHTRAKSEPRLLYWDTSQSCPSDDVIGLRPCAPRGHRRGKSHLPYCVTIDMARQCVEFNNISRHHRIDFSGGNAGGRSGANAGAKTASDDDMPPTLWWALLCLPHTWGKKGSPGVTDGKVPHIQPSLTPATSLTKVAEQGNAAAEQVDAPKSSVSTPPSCTEDACPPVKEAAASEVVEGKGDTSEAKGLAPGKGVVQAKSQGKSKGAQLWRDLAVKVKLLMHKKQWKAVRRDLEAK